MSAEKGYAPAQAALGAMYLNGLGVRQDYVQADMWLNVAASRSDADSWKAYAEIRDSVESEMTSAQVAEAQRLAREWKPR
jgi:TPR repeat protein